MDRHDSDDEIWNKIKCLQCSRNKRGKRGHQGNQGTEGPQGIPGTNAVTASSMFAFANDLVVEPNNNIIRYQQIASFPNSSIVVGDNTIQFNQTGTYFFQALPLTTNLSSEVANIVILPSVIAGSAIIAPEGFPTFLKPNEVFFGVIDFLMDIQTPGTVIQFSVITQHPIGLKGQIVTFRV